MNKPISAIVFSIVWGFVVPLAGQLTDFEEGFENVINLDPPAEDGQILDSGWQGALRSEPEGFTGIFQGVPPDGMGGGGGFLAHDGPINSYMGVSFTSAGSFTIDDVISTWMMSPVLEIENGDVLSFYTRTVPLSMFPDRLDVRLSMSGSSTNVGNSAFTVGSFTTSLMTINSDLMMGGYPEEWTKFEIEFSDLQEPVIGRFAFHYFIEDLSINANAVGIDTVMFGDPEPDCLLGDVNLDGFVSLLDVEAFVQLIVSGNFQCEGDVNEDGQINLEDVQPFVEILQGG